MVVASTVAMRRATAEQRVAALDWGAAAAALDAFGAAILPGLLSAAECRAIAALYAKPEHFRSHIIMARHGFGRGEYRYFAYPLPAPIGALRGALYSCLAPIANAWSARMGAGARYPATHAQFLKACHAAGQTRPTPLLLKYVAGDYNCLHQDLYGELAFPLQATVLLSAPGEDFTGGEFVLTELKPRMQSRVEVVPLRQGGACLFAVNHHPAKGTRGYYRAGMRHGVSQVRSGHRMTLGIIFHDAR